MSYNVVQIVFLLLSIVNIFALGTNGSTISSIARVPYQASIKERNFGHVCGGSILSSRHVLTAAYCFSEDIALTYNIISDYYVTTGSTFASKEINRFDILDIKIHPNYTGGHNNIAVVILTKAIKFDNSQQPLVLPIRHERIGTSAILSDWGYPTLYAKLMAMKGKEQLRTLKMKILSREQCASDLWTHWGQRLGQNEICTEGKNKKNCFLDGGSPLVVKLTIVGVLGFSDFTCGPSSLDVYTEVYSVKNFILSAMAEDNLIE